MHPTTLLTDLVGVLPNNVPLTLMITSVHGRPETVSLRGGHAGSKGRVELSAHQQVLLAQAQQRLHPTCSFVQAFGTVGFLCAPVGCTLPVPSHRAQLRDQGAHTSVIIGLEHDGKGHLVFFSMDQHVHPFHTSTKAYEKVETSFSIGVPLPLAIYDNFFARLARMQGPFFVWQDKTCMQDRLFFAPNDANDRHFLDALLDVPRRVLIAPETGPSICRTRPVVHYP